MSVLDAKIETIETSIAGWQKQNTIDRDGLVAYLKCYLVKACFDGWVDDCAACRPCDQFVFLR